jgi:glycerophosphoryl diester phosphodiesterase
MLEAKSFTPPWIIAHRGFQKNYPENTLVAFQAAMDAGAQMIELDISLSSDRKPVVIHDATLERTTNGHGPVNHYTLNELKELDAGSWFHARFANQRLPELSEVLGLANGRAIVNIEIKSHAYEPHHPADTIEKQVVDLVKQKSDRDKVLISSFNINILDHISSIGDSPALALISEKPADDDTLKICERLKAFSWHPDHRILTHQQVQLMHDAGIRVFPYNVGTPGEYRQMLAMNVDGVITSDPFIAGARSNHKKAA